MIKRQRAVICILGLERHHIHAKLGAGAEHFHMRRDAGFRQTGGAGGENVINRRAQFQRLFRQDIAVIMLGYRCHQVFIIAGRRCIVAIGNKQQLVAILLVNHIGHGLHIGETFRADHNQ